MKYLTALFCNRKIEPMNSFWIRLSTIQFHEKNELYRYNCNYHYLDDMTYYFNSKQSLYNFAVLKFKKYAKELSQELHHNNIYIFSCPWYSMKLMFANEYFIISRLWNSVYEFPTFEKSSVRFLTVEYQHPDMSESIPIEMDASWLLVGNELFSSAMILHLLEHQNVHYKFDMRYKINIMDNLIQMHTLTSNQYILLNKNDIQIRETYM